jgi:diguanylate cyclase (GGDEF)-like protein
MSDEKRKKSRRNLDALESVTALEMDGPTSDLEVYSQEVIDALISDDLPPTPNNFSLYFDRLLENKSENLRKQIHYILELEENNDDENAIILEQNLKKGFTSVKSILSVTANLYKNISLMTKILDKRKKELEHSKEIQAAIEIAASLEGDVSKLNKILKKQTSQIKNLYDETAKIVKNVENETIFDNKFGVYNKRYLLTKIEQERELITEFNHSSTLIMIELSRELKDSVKSDKIITLMTRTIARLLLKTSRRSDIVAHYGNGIFAMLLKHTDIESAKKASERLCDLVANTNFFLADREINLKISIGITEISAEYSVEEIVSGSLKAIEIAYKDNDTDYAVYAKA